MSSSFVRWFVAIVTGLLILGSIVFGVRLVMPASSPPVLQPQLATVTRASFPIAINASGTVVPVTETFEGFQVGGVVASINVQVGEQVSSGTVLATLKSSASSNAIAQANANLQTAQAELASAQNPASPGQIAQLQTALSNAQSNLSQTQATVQSINASDAQRVQAQQTVVNNAQTNFNNASCTSQTTSSSCTALLGTLTTAQQQLLSYQDTQTRDEANGQLQITQAQATVSASQSALSAASTPNPNTVSSAQAKVAAAQSAVRSANAAANAYELISNVSGTVLQINGQVGALVSGGQPASSTLPGILTPTSALALTSGGTGNTNSPFMIIGSPNDFVVGFAFPASELSVVSAGNSAMVTGTATNFAAISGSVRAVSQSPVILGGVPSYYATIDLTSTKGLRVGDTLNVSVTSSEVNNAISIPSSAVYQLGGGAYVDVWNGHVAVPTPVTLGAQGVNRVQVTSGLRDGEQVVEVANQGFTQAVAP